LLSSLPADVQDLSAPDGQSYFFKPCTSLAFFSLFPCQPALAPRRAVS